MAHIILYQQVHQRVMGVSTTVILSSGNIALIPSGFFIHLFNLMDTCQALRNRRLQLLVYYLNPDSLQVRTKHLCFQLHGPPTNSRRVTPRVTPRVLITVIIYFILHPAGLSPSLLVTGLLWNYYFTLTMKDRSGGRRMW